MASVSLTPSIDNYGDSNSATANNGTAGFIAVGEDNTATATYRSLVKWDLSSIPAGSTITATTLTLTVHTDRSDNARTLSVFRVLRAWTETGSTWNNWDTGQAWGTAMCANTTSDREATDIGTATQPANPAVDSTVAVTLTASKVQEWLDGVLTNNGILLQVATETDDGILYYSREEATATKRPTLDVTYTPPPSAGNQAYSIFM